MLGFGSIWQIILKKQSQDINTGAGWFPLAFISSASNEAGADVAVYFTNHLLHPAAPRVC